MGKAKDKVLIPTYQMGLNGFYLLLRVQMEKRGSKNINGVGKEFFAPETYRKGKNILAELKKRDMVTVQDENVLVREGLEKALDRIIDSPHCMNFQNAVLRKKEQNLTFYYADDFYVGVLLDKKNTRVVVTAEEDALYKAFEKQLEDKTISNDFHKEQWNVLWRGEDASEENRGILQPLREARITHCGNHVQRERFNTAMVADNKQIQIIRGADSLSGKALNRETVPIQDWYGVICQEFERLKAENQRKSGKVDRNAGKEDSSKEKSEYQRVTAAPDFPQSGLGFLFWSLKRIIIGFPKMLLGMIRRKSLALLLYPLWGVLLFFYNMYMTCYINDTFMLDRRSRLGNLSPYLMAGTLRTPSSLKGLQMKWGLIDTSFLVWPLMMVLTLLLRHIILQLRQKKTGFFGDLVKITGAVKDCMAQGYGKGKFMWLVLAVMWILGFCIMNPITIFLAAVLLLLMFAQGTDNSLVRIAFLWACASGRKKIDGGQKPEPDSRKYRIMLFHGCMGLTVYGLVSMLLWFVADYNWWIRLVVTVLMVLFALLQVFMPGAISGRLHSKVAVIFLICMISLCAAAVFGSSIGVVFADDGGWSESGGKLAGLLQNAGFSTILGISLLTIGLALGLPLVGAAILGLVTGVGTFAFGLTDTEAGDYVRKSARQYFFGPKEGENKTVFCAATELLNFAASFANPTAEMAGTALKVFQGGKLVGDVVSTIGDVAGTVDDFNSYKDGSGDVGIGDLLWDALGLGLDCYGMIGDYGDFKKAMNQPEIRGNDLYESFKEQRQELQDTRQNAITDMENGLNSRRQAELDAENLRHQNKMNDIQDTIERLENGEITPPRGLDHDTYLRELNRSLGTETTMNANNLSDIRGAYKKEFQDSINKIQDTYSKDMRKLVREKVKDFVIDHGYDVKSEGDNLLDFLTTNGFYHADAEEAADFDMDKLLGSLDNMPDEELERLIERLKQ